jgi:hypothetical protein
MAIVSALLLDNDDVELGPVGYFGATALYTSFSDGTITSIMLSMFGDLNPTIKSQSEKIMENTYAVFSGKKTIGAAATSSIGALAPLKRLEVTT